MKPNPNDMQGFEPDYIPFSANIVKFDFQKGLQGMQINLEFDTGHEIVTYESPEDVFNLGILEVLKLMDGTSLKTIHSIKLRYV